MRKTRRKEEYLGLLKEKLKELAKVTIVFPISNYHPRQPNFQFSFDNQAAGTAGAGTGGEVSKEDARQRFLENEIHKTTLKMTEVIFNYDLDNRNRLFFQRKVKLFIQADMVKKKYELILSMLKNERLTYFNQVITVGLLILKLINS